MVPSIIDVWGYDRGFVHLLLLRLLLQIELAYLKNEITYSNEILYHHPKRLVILIFFVNDNK